MIKLIVAVILNLALAAIAFGQTYIVDIKRESARSDKLTGGRIQRTVLEAGNPNIRITLNVPSFQMTLWQDGNEVRSYPVGVGMLEFPVAIGMRNATSIEVTSGLAPGDRVSRTDPEQSGP